MTFIIDCCILKDIIYSSEVFALVCLDNLYNIISCDSPFILLKLDNFSEFNTKLKFMDCQSICFFFFFFDITKSRNTKHNKIYFIFYV